jgi:hypothetical protein
MAATGVAGFMTTPDFILRCDQMKSAIEIYASFMVDGDPIGAGFGKRWDEFIRSFNHEMTIERNS